MRAEKNSAEEVKEDVFALINSVRKMYQSNAPVFQRAVMHQDESRLVESMIDREFEDEDAFIPKIDLIENYLLEKDFSSAKHEILNARALIQGRNYSGRVGLANSHNIQTYLNEAFIQLASLR